ncbi:MAG: septum formation family protein, partial [Acidimicrobiia bacterium]
LVSNALGGVSVIDPNLSLAAVRILSLASSVAAVVAAILAMRIISMVNTGLWARRALAGWPLGPRPLSRQAKLAWSTATGALTLVSAAGFGVMFPALVETLEQVPANNLEFAVGDCFNHVVDDYEVVSCEGPHYAETYRVADHPDQAFYPGDSRLADWAEPFCYRHFESYTGIAYQDSALDFGYLYPTEGSWNGGDREVICFVFNLSGDDLIEPVGTPIA